MITSGSLLKRRKAFRLILNNSEQETNMILNNSARETNMILNKSAQETNMILNNSAQETNIFFSPGFFFIIFNTHRGWAILSLVVNFYVDTSLTSQALFIPLTECICIELHASSNNEVQ